jgi:hypothetical protein
MTETTTAPAAQPAPPSLPEAVEKALARGDFSQVSAEDRLRYLAAVCQSLGLNPLTQPFAWLTGQGGKLVLYPRKDAAEQLRKIHHVTLEIVSHEVKDEVCTVHVRATLPGKTKRTDEDLAAVSVQGLKGEARANAIMKCITKAKRRATLSICGLGLPDIDEPDVAETTATERPAPERERQTITPREAGPVPEALTGPPAPKATEQQCEEMKRLVRALGLHAQQWGEVLAKRGVKSGRDLTPEQAQEVIDKMRAKVQMQATQPANGQLQPIAAGGAPGTPF